MSRTPQNSSFTTSKNRVIISNSRSKSEHNNDDSTMSSEQEEYLCGISASFDHSEFERNLRHVIRIRRHAIEHSGPTREEYYQSLMDSYKKQQEAEEREKLKQKQLDATVHPHNNRSRHVEKLPDHDGEEQQLRLLKAKFTGKNNSQAEDSRLRIKNRFGENFDAAGHALLHGSRLPETASVVADCSVTTAANGCRATLWERTLKQWRREKLTALATSDDTRAHQAMAAVGAKFEQEEMKSKLTGDEVEEWAAHIIASQLSDKTKGAVGKIQAVISRSRKSERSRLRRDYFKAHPDALGAATLNDADAEELRQSTRQGRLEQELLRLISKGGDFTKEMSPELHGLWLRSLLPGQQRVSGGQDSSSSSSSSSSTSSEGASSVSGSDLSCADDAEINNNIDIGNNSKGGLDVLQRMKTSQRRENSESSLRSSNLNNLSPNHKQRSSKTIKRPSNPNEQLVKAKVDPLMLERETIRERAKRILFGGVSATTTELKKSVAVSDDDEANTKDTENQNVNKSSQLSRVASTVSVFSSVSQREGRHAREKNIDKQNVQTQQRRQQPEENQAFLERTVNTLINTPALSEVSRGDPTEENLFSPHQCGITDPTVPSATQRNVSSFVPTSRNPVTNNILAAVAMRTSNNLGDSSHSCRRHLHLESPEKLLERHRALTDNVPLPPSSSSSLPLSLPSASSTATSEASSLTFLSQPHSTNGCFRRGGVVATANEQDNFVYGGANLSTTSTAKEAHEKIMHLLDAEIHDSTVEGEEPKEQKFARLKEAAARAKYLKATKHWGDSKHALVWDFELRQIKERVGKEVGRNATCVDEGPSRSPSAAASPQSSGATVSHCHPSRQPSTTFLINNDSSSSSSSSSPPQQLLQQQSYFLHASSPIQDPAMLGSQGDVAGRKKSERLQKIERTIQLLEAGKIGNVVAKQKFHCRLERTVNAAASTSLNTMMMAMSGGGKENASVTTMMMASDIPGGSTMNAASLKRSSSVYAPAVDVLTGSPKQPPKDASIVGTANATTSASSQSGQQQPQPQQQKKVLIPELDKPYGKYHCALDIKLNHLDPQTGKPIQLRLTNMPEPDLYAYQRYAKEKNMVIIIRPVSEVVPQLYATPGLHIKGKSINVSLKSSSYRPIDGLIPVNPALGKAYLDAMRREREIEDMILNATGGVVTVSLLKRLRAQKAAAGSLTQAFRRDIITALERSDHELNQIMEEYREKLVVTVDKESISRAYIERFNEAQFLGTTHVTWKRQGIFYREIPNVGVERDPREAPVFYIETQPGEYFRYIPESDSLDEAPTERTDELHPVMVVTHRMFTVSETTKRIEPDPTLYMIGPDFDGLVYARRVELAATGKSRMEWATEVNDYKLNRTMGLVNRFDVEHVKEVRVLTEWKQNHGYECGNTVKTQPTTVAAHAVITPDSFSILNNIFEIVGYIRAAWQHNIPLLVNPNWRVVIDCDRMPRLYGEDLALPVVDDCGSSAVQTRFEVEAGPDLTYDSVKKSVGTMSERVAQMRKDFREKSRGGAGAGRPRGLSGVAGGEGGGGGGSGAGSNANQGSANQGATDEGEGTLEDAVKLVIDKKEMSELFFCVRRWQFMPPVFVERQRLLNSKRTHVARDQSNSSPVSSPPISSLFSASNSTSNVTEVTGSGHSSPHQPLPSTPIESKFYSDGRTRWDATIDDPIVDEDFDRFTKSKVEDALIDYRQGKEDFLLLHHERGSRAFVDMLDEYLLPEPYIKT